MANRVEKAITKHFPGWALRRAQARHNLSVLNSIGAYGGSAGGYRGGHYGRLRSAPRGSTQAEDTAAGYTYHNMIANSMDLYRNDPMCKSVVDVSGTYLGESRPTATTDDPAWNALATQYFNEYWWPQADARGRSGVDFGELQLLFDKWCWLGGDMLFMPFNGQLLPYEGLQIQTPWKLRADRSIVNGIRMRSAAPWPITHYYITDRDRKTGKETFSRLRASQAIYAGSRNWRAAMVRSVPDLHGVIDAMHAYNKTSDNVQKRIEFESMIFTVERAGAISRMPGRTQSALDSSSGASVEHTKADYGMRLKVNGSPKDDFVMPEMKNPSGNYTQVMDHMGRYIAAGTGFPFEIVMHIYTSGSYTANRAARLDFAKALMCRWAWRNKVLNQRVYNWRIAKAIKAGELPPAPVDEATGLSQWHKCAWTLPHFPHIDEGKEVVADVKQWGCGQESLGDWAQQKGRTRGQMLDAHDADIREMQTRADTLGMPLEQYMGQLFTASAAPDTEDVPLDDDTEKTGVEKWLT